MSLYSLLDSGLIRGCAIVYSFIFYEDGCLQDVVRLPGGLKSDILLFR